MAEASWMDSAEADLEVKAIKEAKKPKSLFEKASASAERIKEGAIENLPIIGAAIGGGAAAIPSLGVGALPGAAAGGALGKSLQTIIREYQGRGESPSIIKRAIGEPLEGAIQGLAGEAGGQVVGKGVGKGIEVLRSFAPVAKKSAEKVIEAAGRMKIPVLQSQVSEPAKSAIDLGRMELSLATSPTLFSRPPRERIAAIHEGIQREISDITKPATTETKAQVGQIVKNGILEKVAKDFEPSTTKFKYVKEATKDIELGDKAKSGVIKSLEDLSEKQVFEHKKPMVNQYISAIKNAKNADDLKTILTDVNDSLQVASKRDIPVLIDVKSIISSFEDNMIAKSLDELGPQAIPFAQETKEVLSSARKEYAGLMSGLREVKEGAAIKSFDSPDKFAKIIDKIPEEKLVDKFFTSKNPKFLKAFEAKYPEEAKLLKEYKMSEIMKNSEYKGIISPNIFVSNLDNISPEAQEHIFGKAAAQKIADLKTVVKSLPEKFNSSNTAEALKWYQQLGLLANATEGTRLLFFNYVKNLAEKAPKQLPINLIEQQAARMAQPSLQEYVRSKTER